MDPALSKLLIGLAVNISRSDGRIHSAIVKTANVSKSTVNVEWAEHGMTKGKEVDMNELNHLNSDLIQHLQPCHQEEPAPTPIPTPMTRMTKSVKASELPLRSSRIPTTSERKFLLSVSLLRFLVGQLTCTDVIFYGVSPI